MIPLQKFSCEFWETFRNNIKRYLNLFTQQQNSCLLSTVKTQDYYTDFIPS